MAKEPESPPSPADEGAAAAGEGASQGNGAAPSMNIMGQYLKDLSFENPNAPQSLNNPEAQPQIDISVNVNARTLAPGDYEVELQLGVKAVDGATAVFQAEMQYAGIFRLENIPEEHMHPIVLIECPRMLFPFARQILAGAIRDGGFPPLMLDPIDFGAMYQQRMQEQAAKADA